MAGKGGGAWKVAYADFVTAMMAFFLVMWITAQSKQVALARLTAAGAVQSNLEMALFEMMRTAESPQFKAVQQLIK